MRSAATTWGGRRASPSVRTLLGAFLLAGGVLAQVPDRGAAMDLDAGRERGLRLVLPVYNEAGLRALEGPLAPFVDARTTLMVVSGNERPPFEPSFAADAAARLRTAHPASRVVIATSGLAHLAQAIEVVAGLDPVAAGWGGRPPAVVYIYEPHRPDEPEFTWDFDGTLAAFDRARSQADAAGVTLLGKPTGRPILEAGLQANRWDYGRLAGRVEALYVQTQTYCRAGMATFARALGALAAQVGTTPGTFVQVSVGPTFPNGVTPDRAMACLGAARRHVEAGVLTGVLVWWSPEALEDARQVLRHASRPSAP